MNMFSAWKQLSNWPSGAKRSEPLTYLGYDATKAQLLDPLTL
jgi:hypothetical protein